MIRIIHYGPLIALAIIKCVSLTTLYYIGKWMPLSMNTNWNTIVNYFFYYFLLASTLYNFLLAIFIGPGYVPDGWRPENPSDEPSLQYCHRCEAFKAPRSHHCSKCKKCILKMDHHCPWINNCCGFRNQKYFIYFLLSAVVGSIHSMVLLSLTFYRALYFIPNDNNQYLRLNIGGVFAIFLSFGFSVGVVIAVGSLLYLQIKILLRNRTSIEDWIVTKANVRERSKPFVYPYHLGVWRNIQQVLINPSYRDGIRWPVRAGCHQYTLTREQIKQKQNKLSNASMYRVIKPYNGRFFPLFSQGLLVCLTFPINDDPRLVLQPGDEILVTYAQKRWLYGQKINDNPNNLKILPKGWFPSRCVVYLVQPNSVRNSKKLRTSKKLIGSNEMNNENNKKMQ